MKISKKLNIYLQLILIVTLVVYHIINYENLSFFSIIAAVLAFFWFVEFYKFIKSNKGKEISISHCMQLLMYRDLKGRLKGRFQLKGFPEKFTAERYMSLELSYLVIWKWVVIKIQNKKYGEVSRLCFYLDKGVDEVKFFSVGGNILNFTFHRAEIESERLMKRDIVIKDAKKEEPLDALYLMHNYNSNINRNGQGESPNKISFDEIFKNYDECEYEKNRKKTVELFKSGIVYSEKIRSSGHSEDLDTEFKQSNPGFKDKYYQDVLSSSFISMR